MMSYREQQIIDFFKKFGESSSKEIFDKAEIGVSYATLKRLLSKLISLNYLATKGNGKGTRYLISPLFEVIEPLDIDQYFAKEIDERSIMEGFSFSIMEVFAKYRVFTDAELSQLDKIQDRFTNNIAQLSEIAFNKEFERLAIDLSWKSSQIEGNTYSLLEAEKLLKDKQTAAGKTMEEAVMLLNHKEALDFVINHPDYLFPLSVSSIEDIHGMLVKNLAVEKNLRKRRIGISGTNYRPLDNEFQISEALQKACVVINSRDSAFEKALLALVLISYIQPFMDGNKRTARIVSNALLMHVKHCPLSFRTVDSIDYKKAMLLFYEQNNISKIKEIFISQFEFAVNTYF